MTGCVQCTVRTKLEESENEIRITEEIKDTIYISYINSSQANAYLALAFIRQA